MILRSGASAASAACSPAAGSRHGSGSAGGSAASPTPPCRRRRYPRRWGNGRRSRSPAPARTFRCCPRSVCRSSRRNDAWVPGSRSSHTHFSSCAPFIDRPPAVHQSCPLSYVAGPRVGQEDQIIVAKESQDFVQSAIVPRLRRVCPCSRRPLLTRHRQEQDTVVDRFRQCAQSSQSWSRLSWLSTTRLAAHGRSWQLAHFQPFGVQHSLDTRGKIQPLVSRRAPGIKNL